MASRPAVSPVAREVTPKPKGPIAISGSVTLTDEFQDVGDCKYVVTKDKKFQICSIAVSSEVQANVRIMFGNGQIGITYYIPGRVPFTHWFGGGYRLNEIKGDGSKEIRIQARHPAGGSAGDFQAELTGEEVS